MEINKKNIKGIFQYSPDVKFTEGDFVIEDDCIYICQESSIGKSPKENPSQFKKYLFGEVTDEITDKSLSPLSSYGLAKALLWTCNFKGEIDNDISPSGEVFLRDYFGDELGFELGDKYINPLDNLIASDINQSVFTVSKEVTKPIFGIANSNTNSILRQYTYKSNDTTWIRVQELINPINADVYYRTATRTVPLGQLEENYSWGSIGDWKPVSVNSSFKMTISGIESYYRQKINELELLKLKMKSSFRFKEVPINFPESYSYSSSSSLQTITAAVEGDIVTVCTKFLEENNIFRTDSITVDLGPLKEEVVTSLEFGVVGNAVLRITYSSGMFYFQTTGCGIYSIYQRLRFEDEYGYSSLDLEAPPVEIPTSMNSDTILVSGSSVPEEKKTDYILLDLPNDNNIVIPVNNTLSASISFENLTLSIVVANPNNVGSGDFIVRPDPRTLLNKNLIKAYYVKTYEGN